MQMLQCRKALSLLVLVTLFVVACSGDSSENKNDSVPRAVTNEESQMLSRMLYNNHLAKNVSFIAQSGSLENQGFVAKGKVDWENMLVQIAVGLRTTEVADISSITTSEIVYEKYLGLDESIGWVSRASDPGVYGIDALSLFMIKLASDAPDNPLLVKQDGAQFLGEETIDGEKVLLLKSPGGITFYVTEDGVLKKIKAPIKGFANEVIFTLSNHSKTSIEVPDPDSVVPIEEISAFYLANRPNF